MKKALLIGTGSGLLVLAVLGVYWVQASDPAASSLAPAAAVTGPKSGSAATPPSSDVASGMPGATDSAPSAGASTAPWSSSGGAPASATAPQQPALSREETRQVRAQVRAKLAELQARGPNVTVAEAQATFDEVERLSRGTLDPRFFGPLRETLKQAARAQELGRELTQVSQSTRPADVARQQAILAEMRELSFRLVSSSQALQAYARDMQGKTP